MPEQRYSLEEAGRLLGGLHPNTVRNRAAKGKYHYEKDNSGKWFVFLDPEKIANDPLPRKARKEGKVELEAPMEPTVASSLKALETTIQVLSEELEATRTERDAFKAKAEERAEVAARLEIAMASLSAKSEAAAVQIEELRHRLERETDENRSLLLTMLERMAAPKPAPLPTPTPEQVAAPTKPGGRRWSLFGRHRA